MNAEECVEKPSLTGETRRVSKDEGKQTRGAGVVHFMTDDRRKREVCKRRTVGTSACGTASAYT